MKTLRCPVRTIDYYNHDTRRVLLDIPAGESVTFKPGQYLNVVLPEKRCPFSIASAPALENQVELHIRPTPDSGDSDLIEAMLNTASELQIELPIGNCYLESPPDGPLILLAASTGITQMKSIIEHLLPQGLRHDCFLYWGVLSDQDLYLDDLCRQWHDTEPRLHYRPVVSEPATSPGWTGRTGLVGEVALAELEDISNAQVFVSGGPGMVYATLDAFVAAGLPPENMHSDVFSYAPRNT